jgi:hypothetical membrane protein
MAKLAVAGIAAPILFTALVVIQGLLQPDYSHIVMPISALAVWPYGWIQNANFYVFGSLMTATAIGRHRGMRPSRAGVVGPGILMLSGVGLMLAGVFPMIKDASGAIVEPPGHAVASILAFLGAGIGLALMSGRMSRDPAWQSLSDYTRACGIAIVILFMVMASFAVADDAPLHSWFGLLQRVVLAVWLPCTIVLAARLLRDHPNC